MSASDAELEPAEDEVDEGGDEIEVEEEDEEQDVEDEDEIEIDLPEVRLTFPVHDDN